MPGRPSRLRTRLGFATLLGYDSWAAYVVEKLREVGLEAQSFESDPGRTTVAVRIPGADRTRGLESGADESVDRGWW